MTDTEALAIAIEALSKTAAVECYGKLVHRKWCQRNDKCSSCRARDALMRMRMPKAIEGIVK